MLADMRRTEGSLRVAMKQMQESETMPDDFGLLPGECVEQACWQLVRSQHWRSFYKYTSLTGTKTHSSCRQEPTSHPYAGRR